MINASIVLYNHSPEEIRPLVVTLRESVVVSKVFLIDNSPVRNELFNDLDAIYIYINRNIGYGSAHNIAMRCTLEEETLYHLVINPDIAFENSILEEMMSYMNHNMDIGWLMPKVFYPNGQVQYLCKLIPTPFDLLFRRFLPEKWTRKQTARFEMHSTAYDHVMDVPYLSGCFMLLRTRALVEIGLFDERFFMYPEDIDLSRRMHRKYRTVFFPAVKIVHHHAHESYSNFKMLFVHIVNLIKYFNKWGWLIDKERDQINKKYKH